MFVAATSLPPTSFYFEPSSYTYASKSLVWQNAMIEEYNAFINQGTWALTPLPPTKSAIGCKFVYIIKNMM